MVTRKASSCFVFSSRYAVGSENSTTVPKNVHNDNPAQILDFAKFVDDVMNIYAKNVNHYYTQLHKIKKRDIKDVLGR